MVLTVSDKELIGYAKKLKSACDERHDEYCRKCPFNKDRVCTINIPSVWDIPLLISDDEKAILRNLDGELKWVARDKDGKVFIYTNKPIKIYNSWNDKSIVYKMVFPKLFQWVKWEDEEPYYIPDLLDEN